MQHGGSWHRLGLGLIASALLSLAPALAGGWHRADSANFRIHGERPAAELAEQARLLEAFRLLVADLKGRDPAAPGARLDVFLVPSPQAASPWQPLRPGIAGFYRADAGRISAVVVDRPARGPFDVEPREVLLHEVAHHLLLAGGLAWPAWYVEGFADYVSTARFTADRVELGHAGASRLGWLQRGDWLPIEAVLAFDPARASSADMARLYAQSWLLAHWLHQDAARARQLVAYLEACAAGADPVEAFRAHVSPDLRAVEAALRAYLADGLHAIVRPRVAPEPAPAVAVAPLPASASSLLMRQVALEHRLLPADSRRALADVRRLAAARGATDPLAAHALAQAELALGDPRLAARLADELLAAAPDDPDLLRLRAEALRLAPGRATSWEARAGARDTFARALEADPLDWRAHLALARLDRVEGGDGLAHLLAAQRLAPQVKAVTLEAAVALARSGRMAESASLLASVAHAPADGGLARDVAQRMLAHARRGDRSAFLAEVGRLHAAPTVAAAQGAVPDQAR